MSDVKVKIKCDTCGHDCLYCDHCSGVTDIEVIGMAHFSDCSVHNEPAKSKGECDCGGFHKNTGERYITEIDTLRTQLSDMTRERDELKERDEIICEEEFIQRKRAEAAEQRIKELEADYDQACDDAMSVARELREVKDKLASAEKVVEAAKTVDADRSIFYSSEAEHGHEIHMYDSLERLSRAIKQHKEENDE